MVGLILIQWLTHRPRELAAVVVIDGVDLRQGVRKRQQAQRDQHHVLNLRRKAVHHNNNIKMAVVEVVGMKKKRRMTPPPTSSRYIGHRHVEILFQALVVQQHIQYLHHHKNVDLHLVEI